MSKTSASVFASAFALFLFMETSSADPVPEPLQKAYEMRNQMKTAYVKYRLGSTSGSHDKMMIHNEEARICGNSYLVIDHGDDDGIMNLDRQGNPLIGHTNSCSPRKELMDAGKGESWMCLEGSNSVGIHDKDFSPFDVRTIGTSPLIARQSFEQLVADMKESHAKMTNFKTEQKGELIEVTSERKLNEGGPFMNATVNYSWTIDPSKNYAMILGSTTIKFADGTSKKWGESQTEYKLIDGYWFPSRFSGWNIDFDRNEKRSIAEFELVEASFDRPEHPQQLTVAMLDIPAGASIGTGDPKDHRIWDGTKAVPLNQWRQIRQARGPLKKVKPTDPQKADKYRYPAWWYVDSGTMGIADLEIDPNTWEAYVRRWCLKNSVDDKQRTEAKSVLESSRKEARAILDKCAPELDKIEALLKDKTLEPRKADEARAEANRLLAPIAEIFNRLKARLESLLLQKQVSAKQATSAPARTP